MLEVAANILYIVGLSAKFRGKHVGPVLWCVASTRTTRRSLILLHAFSLTHARGCSQTRTGFCLVVLLQQAIRPARGGWTCSSGFDTVEAVVVTSLFVFSKRRRAKRKPNVAVANARVVRFLGVLARLLHETKLLLFNN